MTEEQIEAIRKRAEKSRGNRYTDFNAMRNASHVINEDIPALLAEVERLKSQLSEAESLLSEAHDIMDDVHLYDTELYEEISKYFDGGDA